MREINVVVELSDWRYRACVEESHRLGTSVETVVSRMVHGLIDEMDREEAEGTDHEIFPA